MYDKLFLKLYYFTVVSVIADVGRTNKHDIGYNLLIIHVYILVIR